MKGQRILVLSLEFLPLLLGEGIHHYRVTKDPLPDDAKIIGGQVYRLVEPLGLHLILESAAWDGPVEGGVIPRIEPTLTRIDPQT
jgi:hypothetical protein